MGIKWSAVRLSEAMDMAEEFLGEIYQPLEKVKLVVTEARKIANLPGYADQRLARVLWEIQRMDNIKSAIKAVRTAIPDGALEAEREANKYGTASALM